MCSCETGLYFAHILLSFQLYFSSTYRCFNTFSFNELGNFCFLLVTYVGKAFPLIARFLIIIVLFLSYTQQHCLECDNVETYCMLGCGEIMMRQKLQQHLQYHCAFRMITCEYCSVQIEFIIYEVLFMLYK